MFCESCGNQLETNMNFCESCGSAIYSKVQLQQMSKGERLKYYFNTVMKTAKTYRIAEFLKLIFSLCAIGMVVLVIFSFFGFGEDEYIKTVKQGSFGSYPTVEIGKAFEWYFSDTEWRSFESTEGVNVVEFTGYCYFLDMLTEVYMQFNVYSDGTFNVDYLSFDDDTQSYIMMAGLIEVIMEDYLSK